MIKDAARRLMPVRVWDALRILRHGYIDELKDCTYDQDGLRTIHNCDFMFDPDFARAYESAEALDSWFGGKVQWRVHILFWAVTRALSLEGDLVECGVHRGGFSKAIVEYFDFQHIANRLFYLLDSFEGMSSDQLADAEAELIGEYPYQNDYEAVKETFAEYQNVIIVKGRIPESLAHVASAKVSFLSLDLNNAVPEVAAAEFFWDKLVSGAAVVLDDYGWVKHIVQKRAFDEFAKQRNVPILSLPTGQGLIIKP